jgi:serine/threonine-protein kinase
MDALFLRGLVVEELVVAGGFSQVYRGRDPRLERAVAIKVFQLSAEKEAALPFPREMWRRRFIAEARLLARLDHPHLVQVTGLDRLTDGTPYMLMPWYVANLRREIGRDVTAPEEIAALPPLQRPRAVPPLRAAAIMRQICLGLAPLHARGYVHRDVKPTNVLLTARENGVVKLCDLGMVKMPGEIDRTPSGGDMWLGTPDYAAPEQMEDASGVDDRADIYSLGVVGWRLLTGRLPRPDERDVAAAAPGVPAELADIIAAAMAPSPARRPTALQMAHRLTAMAAQSPAPVAVETW